MTSAATASTDLGHTGMMPGVADDLPTGTVTFLFTDVEASTSAWERSPDAMAVAMRRHHELLDDAITRNHGTRAVEQGAGDSVVAAFRRALDAVIAAVEAQRALRTELAVGDDPMRVRMALHTGDVEVGPDGMYAGPTMNRCGRLLAAAHGGQTILSGSTFDLVVDAPDPRFALRDLGPHRLRDIERPVQIFQVDDPTAPEAFAPLRTVDRTAHTLPARLTTFVGRAEQRRDVAELLRHNRLVTLTGSGGCGKTRLSVEVGSDVLDHFDAGVWFVDLAPVAATDDVATAVARALSIRPASGRPVVDAVVEHLRHGRALVILDNCEHLLDGAAAVADAVLAACPEVHVLATSREPLGLLGETTWRIPSLSLPEPGRAPADSEAGALFLDRARLARPTFTPDDAEVEAIAAICRRLDGIPLAIELAAARVRTLSPVEIADELDNRFRLLTGGGRNVLPRQRTLEASVAWSHDLLGDAERRALRRLSVFAGGFTLDAARQVIADDALAAADAVELVSRLVDRSLVTVVDQPGGGTRYGMLETVRHFASGRLVDAGEAEVTRHRHLDHVRSRATELGPHLEGPGLLRALAELDAEVDNIDAALAWADATGDGAAMVAILWSLGQWFAWRGHNRQLAMWVRRLSAHEQGLSPEDRVRALGCRTHEHTIGADGFDAEQSAAARTAAEWHELARAVGDPWLLGRAAASEASFLWWSRHPLDGIGPLDDAATSCEQAGDAYMALWLRSMTAATETFTGHNDRALARLEPLERPARDLGSPILLTDVLALMGWCAVNLGQLRRARRLADEASELYAPISAIGSSAFPVAVHAWADLLQGRAAASRPVLAELGHRYVRDGELRLLPFVFALLARIDLVEGRWAAAVKKTELVLAYPTVEPTTFYRLLLREVRALAAWGDGDVATARTELECQVEDARDVDDPHAEARAELCLGALEREDGHHHAARDRFHAALATFVDLRCPPDVAAALRELAGLELDAGQLGSAARLLGAASSITAPEGICYRVGRQDAYDRDAAAVVEGLGEEAWAVEHDLGAALSLDEAVAYATRSRGGRGRPALGWDSLTPTEVQVVTLTAEGLSNAAIADRLVMGRETVKTHLSSVYRKLGVANRTELAAAVSRRG